MSIMTDQGRKQLHACLLFGERKQLSLRVVWAVPRLPLSQLVLSSHFLHFDYADATSWEWIRCREKSVAQIWHTKQGVYRRKVRADVRDEPMQVQQWVMSMAAGSKVQFWEELQKNDLLFAWLLLESVSVVSLSWFDTGIWCHLLASRKKSQWEVTFFFGERVRAEGAYVTLSSRHLGTSVCLFFVRSLFGSRSQDRYLHLIWKLEVSTTDVCVWSAYCL